MSVHCCKRLHVHKVERPDGIDVVCCCWVQEHAVASPQVLFAYFPTRVVEQTLKWIPLVSDLPVISLNQQQLFLSYLVAATRGCLKSTCVPPPRLCPQLPLSLLKTAQGQPMLVELKNGDTYNGRLDNCDSWMNIKLKDVIFTSRVRDKC